MSRLFCVGDCAISRWTKSQRFSGPQKCPLPARNPDPPFLAFLDFLAFCLLRFSLPFGGISALFSKDCGVTLSEKPGQSQKKASKEIQKRKERGSWKPCDFPYNGKIASDCACFFLRFFYQESVRNSGKSTWGLSNRGLIRPLSAICAQSSTIVHFCGLFGPLSKGSFRHKMTTIVGNRGQLWTSSLSPHLLSPHLDFPEKCGLDGDGDVCDKKSRRFAIAIFGALSSPMVQECASDPAPHIRGRTMNKICTQI